MYDARTLHAREAVEILEENFGDLVYKTRIRKTVRYAEAPVKGSSVLGLRSDGYGGRGIPRAREGGAPWRGSARACVRGRSPSCSARPRPLSGGESDEPADEPLPPAAAADDQQTLIMDTPARSPAVPRREEAALEETVEHVMPTAPQGEPARGGRA